jgi:hypothetical protein
MPIRATLTTATVAALLAAGAGTAAADGPAVPPTGLRDAAQHAQAMRAQGAHHGRLTVPATSDVPVAVHVTRVQLADGGFEWADAGIGAGFAAALLLSAAGVSAVRRHGPMPTR